MSVIAAERYVVSRCVSGLWDVFKQFQDTVKDLVSRASLREDATTNTFSRVPPSATACWVTSVCRSREPP